MDTATYINNHAMHSWTGYDIHCALAEGADINALRKRVIETNDWHGVPAPFDGWGLCLTYDGTASLSVVDGQLAWAGRDLPEFLPVKQVRDNLGWEIGTALVWLWTEAMVMP